MKKQKHTPTWLKLIAVFIWAIITILLFCLFSLFNKNDSNIGLKGKKLFGNFTLYNSEIYVSVPSNGEYEIPQADINSLKSISDDYYDKHIALDKNNVYCGNLIIPNLKPETTVSLGHNYYTDGKQTYYCAPYTILNDSLSTWDKFWQEIQHQYFNTKKPQTYFYPFVKLPQSNSKYYPPSLLNRFSPVITNGKFTYYKGKLMQYANPETLVELDQLDQQGRKIKSSIYLTDGKNIYFKNQKLTTSYNNSIYSFRLEAQNTEEYLVNPENGMVYIENLSFNKENTPYKLISKYSAHVYQTLFLSKNGIYFYNSQNKSIEKAGENPFFGSNYKEIAPLIFYNGTQTLFVDATEHWTRKNYRHGGGRRLKSRSTKIYKLEENLSNNWQKLGTTTSGTIWKNGNYHFYFDEYGENQLLFHPIYKIRNQELAENILQSKINAKGIRKLIKLKELIPVKKQEIIEAKTVFESSDQTFLKNRYLFIILIGIIGILINRWKKKL